MIDIEGEFIHSFTLIAGLPLTTPSLPGTRRWTFNPITCHKLFITRQYRLMISTRPVMKNRFRKITCRNSNTATTLNIGDTALVDSFGNGLLDMFPIAVHKALAIHSAFIFAIEPAVNDDAHGALPVPQPFLLFFNPEKTLRAGWHPRWYQLTSMVITCPFRLTSTALFAAAIRLYWMRNIKTAGRLNFCHK